MYLLLTYLLNGTESFWEATRFSASQEIPCILWNLKVQYNLHKFPPPVPILSQLDPVHTPHPISWRCMLILSSHLCLGLPSGFLPLRFPHQNPVNTSPLPHMRYIPQPSHSSRFYLPNNIGWGVQIIKLLIKLSCIFSAQLTQIVGNLLRS